jgi:hypothetical protein
MLFCVHIKVGVHGPTRVLGNLMSICHCLLLAFGKFANLEWVAMACLGTLVRGRVFFFLTGSADFVVLAPWAINKILSLSGPSSVYLR